jgi:hypothetical protein
MVRDKRYRNWTAAGGKQTEAVRSRGRVVCSRSGPALLDEDPSKSSVCARHSDRGGVEAGRSVGRRSRGLHRLEGRGAGRTHGCCDRREPGWTGGGRESSPSRERAAARTSSWGGAKPADSSTGSCGPYGQSRAQTVRDQSCWSGVTLGTWVRTRGEHACRRQNRCACACLRHSTRRAQTQRAGRAPRASSPSRPACGRASVAVTALGHWPSTAACQCQCQGQGQRWMPLGSSSYLLERGQLARLAQPTLLAGLERR